ncbi:hypothetical protein CDD80_3374 [Ophiocordyceps camponoti-rufipedis]|uniref:C3H1-type domain-containing protein n=1 Tax=Ophiocordyceps camponoti-rufipedis TaxID=2004952 RepID=A0A2C5ZMS2_9HYPO|nr:hypothetical protein CDD80_3374 [Ophiocordyceps camponoti-rufipedis]
MQPWPNQSQNGAEGHGSWPQGFIFSAQPGQFDPNHDQWPDQPASSFSQMGHDASATDYHFDSVHHPNPGAFLAEQPGQSFHSSAGHASIPLNQHQQFSAGQDMLDPTFTNMHPDLFQPSKVNLVGPGIGPGAMNQMELGQGQNHASVFAQHDYSFPSQSSQPFDPSPGFAPPLMPRPSSGRQTHTPVQQHFDGNANLHTFPNAYARHSQPSPLQHGHPQHSPPQSQPQPQSQAPQRPQLPPSYSGDQSFHGTNGREGHFRAHQLAYASQYRETPQPHLQQSHFQQPSFGPQKTFQSLEERRQQPQSNRPVSIPQAPSHSDDVESQGDPQVRRKRSSRDVSETADLLDSKKSDEPDALQPPAPSPEEAKLMAESAKRAKAAHSKIPSSKALPFLAYDGSIKLPAPKSYDKLAPLVAVPSRSGKNAVPGLGYDLPCEIQGRFTGQYKPSFDRIGLDERRDEAKTLLDNYDRSMKALGKRQPKYTEYPHAFKEQLKADEASKNKAEKKAKKELEEERNKPVSDERIVDGRHQHVQIRAATRPADPAAAAAWDITGIVHIEQAVARTSALIAGRVQQAGEFLINLRAESTRAKQALDQATKDKKPDVEVARLKQAADQKRDTLYQALDATVEHADDAVLDNLGGHQKLVLNLVNTLITCIKAGDFSGKLPKIVLELFTHLSMTRKIVETTNFDTVRKRLEDKGDGEVKDLVRELSAKIRKFNKANEPDTATGYTGTSAASRAKARPGVESTKRGRDDDSDASRSVKKMAIEGGSSSLSKKLAQPRSQPSLAAKLTPAPKPMSVLKPRPVIKPKAPEPMATVAATASTASTAAASTAAPPITSTDSPSASSDEKSKSEVKKAAKIEAKATIKKEVKATSSAVSSISSLLDSINAKKPDVAAASASREGKRSETPESPEKMAKRLRKEARRKLRVSWKPEGELVQIKVFEKDDDEDQGRDMNMIRDAADDRSEGMVLKRRGSVAVEEEDDELPYRPWFAPTAVDLSNLTDERRGKNYVTRGGLVVLDTEEQKLMAEREQRELMAIYTDPADIPPSPKSPLPETTTATTAKVGQLPDDEPMFSEVHRRWREAEQLGTDQALMAALKRLEAKNKPSTKLDSILGRLHHQARHPAVTIKASNAPLAVGAAAEPYVLGWLRWDRMATWRDTQTATQTAETHQYGGPEAQAAGRAVEAVVARLSARPFPASAPPEWLDGERTREWWLGFNDEVAARQRKREEEERAAYYQQQQAYAPYMALLQQMTGQTAPAVMDPQVQSMLAAMSQPAAQGDGKKKKGGTLPAHKPTNKALIGTKMCTFWQQGKCARGDKCTFKHKG